MTSSRISYAPCLPLHLSMSPLLAGVKPSILSSPVPSKDGIPPTSSPRKLSSSPIYGAARPRRKAARRMLFQADKPPPSTPQSTIPPKQILKLLKLLEEMEDDITGEVHRVKDCIREARVLIKEYKEERRSRDKHFKEICAKERKETKGMDDGF